jgi:hypothetical protein
LLVEPVVDHTEVIRTAASTAAATTAEERELASSRRLVESEVDLLE